MLLLYLLCTIQPIHYFLSLNMSAVTQIDYQTTDNRWHRMRVVCLSMYCKHFKHPSSAPSGAKENRHLQIDLKILCCVTWLYSVAAAAAVLFSMEAVVGFIFIHWWLTLNCGRLSSLTTEMEAELTISESSLSNVMSGEYSLGAWSSLTSILVRTLVQKKGLKVLTTALFLSFIYFFILVVVV